MSGMLPPGKVVRGIRGTVLSARTSPASGVCDIRNITAEPLKHNSRGNKGHYSVA
jgi:hypothetical protein